MKNARAVVPTIKIQDAVKQIIDSSKEEYILGKEKDNLFLTQTPQGFNLKEIYQRHKSNSAKYKDDDISLYMNLNNVKFIEGEKENYTWQVYKLNHILERLVIQMEIRFFILLQMQFLEPVKWVI